MPTLEPSKPTKAISDSVIHLEATIVGFHMTPLKFKLPRIGNVAITGTNFAPPPHPSIGRER